MNAVSGPTFPLLNDLQQALRQDATAQTIIEQITSGTSTNPKFTFRNDLLFWGNRLYVPDNVELQNKIIDELHNSKIGGHSGIKATVSRVASNFFWPKLAMAVQNFVKQCPTCLQTKPDNTPYKGLLQPLPIPAQIWEDIAMDFITNLPPSAGKTTVWVIVDRLSKYAHFCPLPTSVSASQLASYFVHEYVRLHGFPRSIVSDRDRLFTNQFWKELFRLQGTKLRMSSAYHPQTDGQSEVLNRCLEMYLRAIVGDMPIKWV